MFIINIGIHRSRDQLLADVSAGGPCDAPVTWREARAALRAAGFYIVRYKAPVPAPVGSLEPCHLVELDARDIPVGEVYTRLHGVARALHQDCIAVRAYSVRHTDKPRLLGEALVGPSRERWLPFNADYFVEFE